MRFERRLNWLTGIVVLLAILTYALATQSMMVALIGMPAAIGAWVLGEQFRSLQVPRLAANALVLAAVAQALYSAFRRGVRVEDVCTLVVVILVIKLFDRKAARDYAQLLTLSVFLCLGAVLTSNAFLMGVSLIVMLPLIIAAATVFQLYTAWEQRSSRGGGAGERVTGADPGRDLWRLVGMSTAGAVVVAIGSFVLLPRGVGEDVLGRMSRPATGAQTGFADSVDLGKGGLISESRAIVMDVSLHRPESSEPIGESGVVYYLRGAVLDEYRDGRWVRSRASDNNSSAGLWASAGEKVRLSSMPVDTPDEARLVQRVSVRNVGEEFRHVFALWEPEAISFEERTRYKRNSLAKTVQVRGRGGRLEYTVVSLTADTRPVDPGGRAEAPPVGVPAVREIAERVLAERGVEPDPGVRPADQDARAARAIQEHLQSTCAYTLDVLAAPPGRDPVEWFLTEAKRGHCEYFASAMALLCRSVGVNARVVTGYVAAEYNSASSHYVVRESNAHAWVEVEHTPGRWTRYDPTPPADLDRIHRPALGLAGRFKQWFNALEYAWINSVVSYDQQRSGRLDRAAGAELGEDAGPVERFFRNIKEGGMELWFRALLVGVMAFAACAAALTIVELGVRWLHARVVTRRRRQRQMRSDPELPRRLEQMAVYESLLRAMARAGQAKPRHRPPRAHARAIEALDPGAGLAAERVVDLFYRIRFGHRVLTPEQMRDAEEGLRAFERAMREPAG